MNNQNKKIGLFFGAGAEIAYGMPDGGRFAIDVFRSKQVEARNLLRGLIKQVNSNSKSYVESFLPKGFKDKSVTVFGKSHLATIFKNSLRTHRQELRQSLDNFDESVIKKALDSDAIEQLKSILGRLAKIDDFDDFSLGSDIEFATKLNGDSSGSNLFSSSFISAAIQAVGLLSAEGNETESKTKTRLNNFIRAVLELYVGAAGEETVAQLNSGLFKVKGGNASRAIDIFEDFDDIFQLDYSALGTSALHLVLDYEEQESIEQDDFQVIAACTDSILRELVASCINYQELIDSHWHYLYSPREDWGKFTKIAVFLEGVKLYVDEKRNNARTSLCADSANYYHDLITLIEKAGAENVVLGTSNYTDLLETITQGQTEVYHLNGKVSERYDPYTNEMFDEKTRKGKYDRITVPLLFTQSGIKPLTSIEMAKRYVRLYEHYETCEHVVIVGFGFNGDDGHINGMFRQLCEQGNNHVKKLTILHYEPSFSTSAQELIQLYKRKLRLSSGEKKLNVVAVNEKGQLSDGKQWFTKVMSG